MNNTLVNLGKKKIGKLKKALSEQQTLFIKKSENKVNIVRDIYIVSQKIAQCSKHYFDGEFVKECMQAVANILFKDKRKEIDDISLSRRTVSRQIDELTDNIELNLTQIASSFEY